MQQNLTVPALGTILGIWAHPDDEAYLSAALMAEARDAGQRVIVVTATDGELGGDGPVADWRRREAVESLAAVGVTDHRLAALRAHASQTAGLQAAVGEDTYRRWWSEETFVRVPSPLEGAA